MGVSWKERKKRKQDRKAGGKGGADAGDADGKGAGGSGAEDAGAPEAKRQRGDGGKRGGGNVWLEDGRELVKENKDFEAYYKRQRVCNEEEWDRFLEAMKSPLPLAIRVNHMRAGSAALCARLADMKRICCSDAERECYAPRPLEWYTRETAWEWLDLDRRQVKKDRRHQRLKDWLYQRESRGLITRQEVVSMLPPLFLEVEAHHLVLDMCAAPGSKTSQMLETMHWASAMDGAAPPSGFVMANDLTWKRANMLAHQVGRLGSPCCVVLNTDATGFPDMYTPSETPGEPPEPFRFDRVLCDVPCTGDGTLRKTPYIWKSWNWRNGMALHYRQLSILIRGLDVLKVGGRLVYSTCSLNPLENEAVVAAALRSSRGTVALRPPPESLSAVRANEGMICWSVPHPDKFEFFDSWESVPAEMRSGKMQMRHTMFPPLPGDDEDEVRIRDSLRHCRRCLPHLMDTGGFFVAVFEKRADLRHLMREKKQRQYEERREEKMKAAAAAASTSALAEPSASAAVEAPAAAAPRESKDAKASSQAASSEPKRGSRRGQPPQWKPFQKDFVALEPPMWEGIQEFFGLADSQANRFAFRKTSGQAREEVTLVSDGAARLLRAQLMVNPVRMVLGGVVALRCSSSHHVDASPWELLQDGAAAFAALEPRRKITMRPALLRRLLSEHELHLDELREAVAKGEAFGVATAIGGEGGEPPRPGSVVVALHCVESESAPRKTPPVAVAAMVSDAALEIHAGTSAAARAALLEELGEQPPVDEILGSGAAGEPEDDAEMGAPEVAVDEMEEDMVDEDEHATGEADIEPSAS